jgi:uncharacterized protein (DUF1697 family)
VKLVPRLLQTGTGIKKDRALVVKKSAEYTTVMKYVALLRGINVGGKGAVDMAGLRAVFEAAGMTAVKTYINSGNVVFSTSSIDRGRLTELLETVIQERFGFKVGLLLRDTGQLRSLVEGIPGHWKNDGSMKCDVFFLWEDIDRPSVVNELPPRLESEEVLYLPGAVVWRTDRENAAKSRVTKLVGTPLYKRMTVRNCNTARKLLEIMESGED